MRITAEPGAARADDKHSPAKRGRAVNVGYNGDKTLNSHPRLAFVSRPGISDLCFVILLILASVLAVRLEPSHRDLWLAAPLSIAAALICTSALLAFPSKVTTTMAGAIHVALLAIFLLGVVLSLLLFVTILFFGTGLVLFVPCLLLALNSAFTIWRIYASRHPSSLQLPRIPVPRYPPPAG
jgi:hypothetical protein